MSLQLGIGEELWELRDRGPLFSNLTVNQILRQYLHVIEHCSTTLRIVLDGEMGASVLDGGDGTRPLALSDDLLAMLVVEKAGDASNDEYDAGGKFG